MQTVIEEIEKSGEVERGEKLRSGFCDGARILLIDDNRQDSHLLSQILGSQNYEVAQSFCAEDVFKALEIQSPDLIMLSLKMPGKEDGSLCQQIKDIPAYAQIPIVFMADQAGPDTIAKGFEEGGTDYISKPLNPIEITSRIGNQLKLSRALAEIDQMNQQHAVLQKAFEKVSMTDSVTQLNNHRFMMKKLEDEVVRYARKRHKFCVVIGDIDNFKRINDTYGHECGDYVLKEIGESLQSDLRVGDTVGRWGGEEFILLLPDTNADGAYIMAERMRLHIEKKLFQYLWLNQDRKPQIHRFHVTITFGISEYQYGYGADRTVVLADEATSEGKKQGRNNVQISPTVI